MEVKQPGDDNTFYPFLYREVRDSAEAIYPFHLSIFVNNLEEARKFYLDILGMTERRSSNKSIHVDFFGHQLTLCLLKDYDVISTQTNNGEEVPCPHFGIVLPQKVWQEIKQKLTVRNVQFLIEPHVRFLKKQWEQGVMFLQDPSGNAIEIKYYTHQGDYTWY